MSREGRHGQAWAGQARQTEQAGRQGRCTTEERRAEAIRDRGVPPWAVEVSAKESVVQKKCQKNQSCKRISRAKESAVKVSAKEMSPRTITRHGKTLDRGVSEIKARAAEGRSTHDSLSRR